MLGSGFRPIAEQRWHFHAVATDDVNVFTRISKNRHSDDMVAPLSALDGVWHDWGIEPKQEKSVDSAKSGALLRVELVNGVGLMPKCKRIGSMVGGLRTLLHEPRSSPTALHSYAGVLQWSCLLNRPMLSCLGCLCEFVERKPCGKVQRVPANVIDELCLCLSLLCCLNVDLARPWSPSVVATDGAQVFGFGISLLSVI